MRVTGYRVGAPGEFAARSAFEGETGRTTRAAVLSPDRTAADIGSSKWRRNWRGKYGGSMWLRGDGTATTA